MADAIRLLNPGGRLIVTTPNRSFFDPSAFWQTDLPPVHLWWFSENSLLSIGRSLNRSVSFIDFTAYNRKHPVLFSYKTPREPMFNSQGRLIRRESLPVTMARKAGILQDSYWLASSVVAPVIRQKNHRRPTMVAVIQA